MSDLQKFARDIYLRLFRPSDSEVPDLAEEADGGEVVDVATSQSDEPAPKRSKIEELQDFLKPPSLGTNITPRSRRSSPNEILNEIKKEMQVYESTKERPAKLEKIYRALITLPPTSVEAERSFSAAGLFLTKLRCKLGDETLNRLVFLRKHFLNQRNK